MDYRFPDGGHRLPPLPQPFFSDRSFQGGYSELLLSPDIMRGASGDYYPIQREIEKEQIRREIIVEEVARRRMLEAEVRREMMIEREIAMRGFKCDWGFSSFEDRLTMQVDRRDDFENQQDHFAADDGFRFGSCGGGLFDRMLPTRGLSLPRGSVAVGAANVRSPPESTKNKLIILPKPKPNLIGEKRKAGALLSAGSSGLSSLLKKKAKEEWSCALCQISATSEQGLKDHLNGKKHKNKEAKLTAPKTGQKYGKLSQKAARFTKSGETSTLIGKGKAPIVGESTQADESGNDPFNTADIPKNSSDGEQLTKSNKDEKEPKQRSKMIREEKQDKTKPGIEKKTKSYKDEKEPKQRSKMIQEEKQDKTKPGIKKKKFKFWCEMCEVGAFSANVMASHKQGKKHMSQLEGVKQGQSSCVSSSSYNSGLFSVH